MRQKSDLLKVESRAWMENARNHYGTSFLFVLGAFGDTYIVDLFTP